METKYVSERVTNIGELEVGLRCALMRAQSIEAQSCNRCKQEMEKLIEALRELACFEFVIERRTTVNHESHTDNGCQ